MLWKRSYCFTKLTYKIITAPVIAAHLLLQRSIVLLLQVFCCSNGYGRLSAFTLTSADVTTNGTCAGSYSVTRTWTATDACGTQLLLLQTINVQDITAPVVQLYLRLQRSIVLLLFAVTATDACGYCFHVNFCWCNYYGTCAGSLLCY
jgi:hypothetical protein